MVEIVINAGDEKVDMIIKSIRNLGVEIKSIDEFINFDKPKKR